jgi:hypothetical protein
VDDFTALREADRLGMAGIILKNHYEPTGARAQIANRYANTRTRAFGGVVLNWPVGGLNPYAAESAIRLGARIVWMPTRDSAHSLLYGDMEGDFFERPGLCLLDENGALKKPVAEILQIAKNHRASVATGHISPEEAAALCTAGREMGVKMILTHPDWYRTVVPLQTQLALARLGAVVEKVWMNVCAGDISLPDFASSIRQIGPGNVCLVTARGQEGCSHPADAMLDCVEAMLECGFSQEDIRDMIVRVPEYIVRESN